MSSNVKKGKFGQISPLNAPKISGVCRDSTLFESVRQGLLQPDIAFYPAKGYNTGRKSKLKMGTINI